MGFVGSLGIVLGWLCLGLVLARVAGLARLGERLPGRVFALLTALFVLASMPTIWRLAGYTADDAWIIARYAAQLVEHGRPVFNPGEPINAVTTPLTMLEMAVLYAVSPAGVMALHKGLGVALAALGLAVVGFATRSAAALCVFAVLVALSPYHALWLVGGLETPVLGFLLLLVAVLTLQRGRSTERPADAGGAGAPDDRDSAPGRRPLWIALLASLAFATRFDSVLFTAPVLLYVLWRCPRARDRAAVALTAAAAPAVLLAFNLLYYGDALPTSFHLKARTALGWHGFVHVVEFFTYSGLFVLFAFVAATRGGPTADRGLAERLRSDPAVAIWTGVFLACVPYATLTATAHMMYGFRAFVPYLVVVAFLLAREVAARTDGTPAHLSSYRAGLLTAVLLVALLQAANTLLMPRPALNATRVGEFRSHWDVPSYLAELERAALAVRADWRERDGDAAPHVYSPNEGIVGYTLLELPVHGRMTGYRRDCPVTLPEMALASRYAIVEEPFVGLHLRGIDLSDWVPVYSGDEFSRGHFPGQRSRVLAYRNPRPRPWDFEYGVADPCPGDGPARRPSPPTA